MIRYKESDIDVIKNRSKNGCTWVYTPETVLNIIDYFERDIADRMELANEERQMLLQQIERTLDDNRKDLPVIPLEVAEAVIWFRNQNLSNEDIYGLTYEEDDGKYASILFQWVEGDGDRDTLMRALVLGYTVEKSLQERINEGVAQLAQVWLHEAMVVNEQTTIEFASKVARFVQDVHAE